MAATYSSGHKQINFVNNINSLAYIDSASNSNVNLRIMNKISTISYATYSTVLPTFNGVVTYDPSYIVKDMLSYDITNKITNFAPATNSVMCVVRQNLAPMFYLNANEDVYDYYDYDFVQVCANFLSGNLTPRKFLTKSPYEKRFITKNDYETLSVFSYPPALGFTGSCIGSAQYVGYNSSDIVTGSHSLTYSLPYSQYNLTEILSGYFYFTNYQYNRIDLPAGPKQIELMFGTSSPILDDSTTYYTVTVYAPELSAPASSIQLFFTGDALPGQSFTINANANSYTFTFADPAVGPNQIYPYAAPFVDDWVINDVVPKLSGVMGAGFTFSVFGTVADANLNISTNTPTSFTLTNNTTSNLSLVFATASGVLPLTESKKFTYNTNCTRFNKQRVMWKNSLGGWDYFNFQAVEDLGTSIDKKSYMSPLPYNYTNTSRMENIYDSEWQKTYVLNTGIITKEEAEWILEIYKSDVVFFDNNGKLRPVTTVESEYKGYVKGRDRVISYSINFRDANKNITS